MNGDTNWTALLGCGHDAPLQGQPKVGGWITCLNPLCQSQQKVVSVTSHLRTPRAGETGIQEPLWTEEEVA